APEDVAARGQVDAASVRRDPVAVRVRPDVLSPDDRVAGEIETDQLVEPVRGDIEPAQLRADGDALVVAAVDDVEAAEQGMASVDVVDADPGFVGDVESPLDRPCRVETRCERAAGQQRGSPEKPPAVHRSILPRGTAAVGSVRRESRDAGGITVSGSSANGGSRIARATTAYAGARSVTSPRNARDAHPAMDRCTRATSAFASFSRMRSDSW